MKMAATTKGDNAKKEGETTPATAKGDGGAATASTPEENDGPPEIDDTCDVLWRDEKQQLRCKVIERRPVNFRKRKTTMSTSKNLKLQKHHGPEPVDGLKAEEIEYYVHYLNQDRRLDEWITLDKFVLTTLERAPKEPTTPEDARKLRRRSVPAVGTSAKNPSGGGGDSTATATAASQKEASTMLTGGNWRGGSGDPSFAALEREHEETTKVKNIEKIFMGGWEVECWYFSPYPDEYSCCETLYVCEFCLKYMRKKKTYRKHKSECPMRHPPGKEIYRELGLSVYEVDGKEHRVYCQNLCLLAKLFLDHKTLYYDVDPFYFYIICEVDDSGAHIVGYFSKEKVSTEEYNLACILTFPQFQKAGYGKFIISMSYELSKREGKTGSPEKPLSDLGKISYRSYWTHILFNLLAKHDPSKNISIKDISTATGIKTEDIISTLQYLEMIKCWKGQHVVFVKQDLIDKYMKQNKQFRLCKPDCLHWEPPKSSSSK